MEPQRVSCAITGRNDVFIVCMLFEYMGVEIRPTIPFHASDGAMVALPFLFIFILKSPVQVSQDLEVFGRELLLGEHRRHDEKNL